MDESAQKAMHLLDQADLIRSGAGPEKPHAIAPPSNPMGVAREFVEDRYTGEALILRCFRGDFYRWDSTCWPEAEARGIRGSLYEWLEHAVYVADGEEKPWDPTRYKVDNVVDALRAIAYLDGSLDPPAWTNSAGGPPPNEIVAVANGLLHVPSRRLLPHTPNYFAHHALPFGYEDNAPYPSRWIEFLEQLWGPNSDSIAALQEVFGYLIGGDTRQQKIFLLVGPRRSGKGTIGRVARGLLGAHNVAGPTLASMATNFGLQALIGRPMALVSDARLSKRTDSSIVVERLLSISGEDALTVDRKYREPWTGRLPTRFMVLTNELPQLTDSSGALASRFVIFVMTKSFYGEEDPSLTDKLLEEAPGILNWALKGLDRLIHRGHLLQPTAGAEALQQLDDIASPISAFLRDRCEIKADLTVGVDDLWAGWKSWCEDQNLPLRTKSVFGRDLMARVPTIRKTRTRAEGDKRVHEYAGIGIVTTTLHNRYDHHDHHDQAEVKQADLRGAGHPGHTGHSNSALKSQLDEPAGGNSKTGTRNGFGTSLAKCSDCGSATYYYDLDGHPKCPRHKDTAKQEPERVARADE